MKSSCKHEAEKGKDLYRGQAKRYVSRVERELQAVSRSVVSSSPPKRTRAVL